MVRVGFVVLLGVAYVHGIGVGRRAGTLTGSLELGFAVAGEYHEHDDGSDGRLKMGARLVEFAGGGGGTHEQEGPAPWGGINLLFVVDRREQHSGKRE